MLALRPYQASAVNKVLRALNTDGRALLVAPTGAGKTEMLCGVIRALPAHARVLVLQQLLDLVAQNAARINKYGLGRSVVTLAGSLPARDSIKGDASAAGVVVATIQTLTDLIKFVGRFDVLVVDEAHHSNAASYRDIIAVLRKRNPRLVVFGLTATPERGDGDGLQWLFGDTPAAVIDLLDLIQLGYLVPPSVMAVPLKRLNELQAKQFGLDEAADSKLLNIKVVHDEVIRTWLAHAQNRQTVMFCTDVAHARGLAEAFRDAGIASEAVDFKTPLGKRRKLLTAFAEGNGPKVITNAILLTEGFDAPPTSCVGVLRKFNNKSRFIQAVGRGLRLAKGKSDCLVLDYVAAAERHGDLVAGLNLRGRRKTPGPGIEREPPTDPKYEGPSVVLGKGDADLERFDVLGVKVEFMAQEIEAAALPAPKLVDGKEVISRAEAVARGLAYYFTGVPCSKGHVSERYIRGPCKACEADRSAAIWANPKYRALRVEGNRARSLEHHYKNQINPEYREKKCAQQRARRANPEYREKKLITDREWRRRMRDDPEYSEKMREYHRKYRAAKKLEASTNAS